jgi:CRP-like cAMP-binding protein
MQGLEQCELFSAFLGGELQEVARTALLQRHAAGKTIFNEGDPGDGFFMILEGQVEISTVVSKSERRLLNVLGPGEYFGELRVPSCTISRILLASSEWPPNWPA